MEEGGLRGRGEIGLGGGGRVERGEGRVEGGRVGGGGGVERG